MFSKEEILERLNQGENLSTEFKSISKWRDEYGKGLIAFANDYSEAGGGILLLGVNDDGTVAGFSGNFDILQKQVVDFCRDKCNPQIAPQIYKLEINGKSIIVIEIRRSESRPIRFKNVCWIRLGSENRPASLIEEVRLAEKALRITFDNTLVEEARLMDLKLDKIKQYFIESQSKEVVQTDWRQPDEIAEHFGFVKKHNGNLIPTVTAILFFARNPQMFFPLSSIDAIKFDGVSVTDDFIDRKEIKGNLDEIVDGAIKFVEQHSYITSEFKNNDINRHDFYEYPIAAVRETIINAVVHRDYRNPGTTIFIKIFDDRMEITSPGGLEPPLTRDRFGTGFVSLRNPTLAQVFRDWKPLSLKFERAGSGIPRIREAMKQNGSLDPEFEIDDYYVKVILPAHPFHRDKRKLEKTLLSDTAAWRSLAIRHKRNRDFSTAAMLFQKVTELEPDSPRNWLERGQVEIKLHRWQKAEKYLQQALMRNPDKRIAGWIHRDLANVLFHLKAKPDQQEQHLKTAIQINPEDNNTLRFYLRFLNKMGRREEANQIYKKIKKMPS